ncbi:MAG: VWA domain-containing protein [Betaproteobacteria bacterium]
MASFIRTIAATGMLAVTLFGLSGDAQQPNVRLGPRAPSASPRAAQQPPPQQPAQQPAQQPSSQQPAPQQPVFRAGINFVRVDVIVSDKQGNPVDNLKASDFSVSEDGKPQTIQTFKLVRLDGGAVPGPDGPPRQIHSDFDEETEAAKDDVRLFAIFLDDYHVRRGTSMRVRGPLERFVEDRLGPSDMVGLMYPLESLSSVRLTRNHDAIVKGIDQFIGRKFDYEPKNQFEEQYAMYPASTVEQIRNQVSLSAIKALIVHLGSLKEGRKSLILVSEGFTNMLPPQLRDPIADMPGFGNPDRGNPTAGENDPREDSARFFSGMDLQTDLREVYAAANRYNVSIYSIDPRGLAASEFDINEGVSLKTDQQYLNATMDTLRELSDETDGRAIVSQNDLDKGMKQIVRDESAYYLIGYSSTQAPSDGKFHEIKVHINRPGVTVRARKGYWALTPEEVTRATAAPEPGPAPAVEKALASASEPTRERVIRTWIGTSRGENGKTIVTFVWEPVEKTPGARAAASEQPRRVSLIAMSADGSASYFRGSVPDAAAADGTDGNGGAAAPRAPARVTFEAPPGKVDLRVSVEGAASDVLDTETKEITVPDLTSPQVTLGTAEVLVGRTPREFQQIRSDAKAVPVATRQFRRTDRLLIRVPAYGPGGQAPTLTARLLNRAGQPMSDLPVAPLPATSEQQVDLPLASLPPGEYLVEVKAGGDSGARQLVGFRVTS